MKNKQAENDKMVLKILTTAQKITNENDIRFLIRRFTEWVNYPPTRSNSLSNSEDFAGYK